MPNSNTHTLEMEEEKGGSDGERDESECMKGQIQVL